MGLDRIHQYVSDVQAVLIAYSVVALSLGAVFVPQTLDAWRARRAARRSVR